MTLREMEKYRTAQHITQLNNDQLRRQKLIVQFFPFFMNSLEY